LCYQSDDWSALIHNPVSFIVFYVVFEIIIAEKVALAALENDDDLLSSLKEEKVLAYPCDYLSATETIHLNQMCIKLQ
jgi:hypothetical protein